MRRKERERSEARRLRAEGWTVRRIALELDVSVSSVSLWVRDLPRTRSSGDTATGPQATEAGEEAGAVRVCGRCRRSLPLSAFNRNGDGHQWWCRECFRAYFRARGDLHRRQSSAARLKREAAAVALVADHLSRHACADCGETDTRVLEHDHVGCKSAGVSALVADGCALPRLEAELAECEVVCVNCHRRRTAARSPSWRTDPTLIERSLRLTPGERRNMLHVWQVLRRSKCVDCRSSDLLALEFDHVRGKRANVTELARTGCRLETLEAEIARCVIRCANCHRRRTRAGVSLVSGTKLGSPP